MKRIGSIFGKRIRGDMAPGVQWGTERGGAVGRLSHLLGPGEQLTAVEQAVTARSAAQLYRIGSRLQMGDRVFYYGQVGISAGYGVTVQPTQVRMAYPVATGIWPGSDESNVIGAVAGVAGAYTVQYVCTGNIAANQFQGGSIVIGGAPYGMACKILSHAVCLAGATVTLYLEDPLPEGVAAGQAAALYCSPYYSVMSPRQAAIEGTADPNTNQWSAVGFPLVNALAGEFLWLQTWGPIFVVAAGGTEGIAVGERQMRFNPADLSASPTALNIAAVTSNQLMGYIIPVTNTAVALPAVPVFGGQDVLLYVQLMLTP